MTLGPALEERAGRRNSTRHDTDACRSAFEARENVRLLGLGFGGYVSDDTAATQ